jgi:hypothetical protein
MRGQFVRGSVSTGAKENESSTGRVWAAGFYDPFSLGARFETYKTFIYLFSFQIFFGQR